MFDTPSDFGLSPVKFPSFHDGQLDAILQLCSSNKRVSLLNPETGSGKSLIYICTALFMEVRTVVVVRTKLLQDQLMRDFQHVGLVDIRGRANYHCPFAGNCDAGQYDCPNRNSDTECAYRQRQQRARNSMLVVTNDAYWLALSKQLPAEPIGQFGLLVLDEAHAAPDRLSDFCAINIVKREVKKWYGGSMIDGDLPSRVKWAQQTVMKNRTLLKKLKSDGVHGRELQACVNITDAIFRLSKVAKVDKYVTEDSLRQTTVTPIWPTQYAAPYLFRDIPRAILSSAVATPQTASYLGIDISTDLDTVDMPPLFNLKRRPITHYTGSIKIRLDHRTDEGQFRLLVGRMDRLIDDRQDRRTIVLTKSYDRARKIVSYSRHSGIMITHDSRSTERAVDEYLTKTAPTVLVSPTVGEGWDFKGDKCRCIVIFKVPFPYTRSPLLKARVAGDKAYRNYLTEIDIKQYIGRGMRDPADWCEVFILDDHWEWFNSKATFSPHVRRSFRRVDKPPKPLTF